MTLKVDPPSVKGLVDEIEDIINNQRDAVTLMRSLFIQSANHIGSTDNDDPTEINERWEGLRAITEWMLRDLSDLNDKVTDLARCAENEGAR